MPRIYMVEGDLKPNVQATLRYKNRSVVTLTSCTVEFHMKNGSDLVVDAPAVVVDASAGIVKYEWQSGDTSDLGGYECKAEFEVTFVDGKTLTFPAKEEEELVIVFRDQYA